MAPAMPQAIIAKRTGKEILLMDLPINVEIKLVICEKKITYREF